MWDQDGTSGVNTHMTNTRNTPVEVLETIMPVKVIRYGLMPDSEGPGLHRGGFGIERVLEFQTDEVDCFIASDRVNTPPWGLAGRYVGRRSALYCYKSRQNSRTPAVQIENPFLQK